MTRVLVTGHNGQVGWELERLLAPLGEVQATDRNRLDIADADSIRRTVRDWRPGIIVNAAAYTAVDKAESDADTAHRVNAAAPGILAEEAKRLGACLVHYSTDYVFDGMKTAAYCEDDTPNPLGVYGRTKLAGEQAIRSVGGRYLILRTSWVYGSRGQNFLRTIRRLAGERDELRIVADQFGAPTWCRQIAAATALLLARSETPVGLYHLTAPDTTSWHGFATAIAEILALNVRVNAISTRDYPLPAPRPANSRLDCSRLARDCGIVLPAWRRQLELCCGEPFAA